MVKNLLIIFAKNPRECNVKTRLAQDIGEEHARAVYENLLSGLIEEHQAAQDDGYDLRLFVVGPIDYFSVIVGQENVRLQKGNTLGDRMYSAISESLKGYERVIIIGSDLPGISKQDISQAYQELDEADIVLGPSVDGGYYLIGMKAPLEVFSDIDWSTSKVLEQTLKKANAQHLHSKLLKKRRDIDNKSDLDFHLNAKNI